MEIALKWGSPRSKFKCQVCYRVPQQVTETLRAFIPLICRWGQKAKILKRCHHPRQSNTGQMTGPREGLNPIMPFTHRVSLGKSLNPFQPQFLPPLNKGDEL